jgi:hypothetical protein
MDIAIGYRKSEINFRLSVRQIQEVTEQNDGIRTERCSLQYVVNVTSVLYYLGLEIVH